MRLYCLPYPLLSILFEQSISGKGRTSYVPIDIHSVKYFTDLLIQAHTDQRSYCRDFPYELSALYTFETLEKFHPPGQILPRTLVGNDYLQCLISILDSDPPLSTYSSRSLYTS